MNHIHRIAHQVHELMHLCADTKAIIYQASADEWKKYRELKIASSYD